MPAADEYESSAEINILPNELIQHIFKFLPIDTLLVCEYVCQHWSELVRDINLWREILVVYSGQPGHTEISEKTLQVIYSHGVCICRLKIQYVYSYPTIQSIIKNCENITSLELIMCRICKDFENDLAQWPQLRRLSLRNSLLLSNDTDLQIQYDKYKKLNYLALSDFGLSTMNCDTLLHCAHLNHIHIEKIKNLTLDYIKELILSKQKILKSLHIYGGDSVNDECLHLLSQCPLLKDLAIIRCENLKDPGLMALVNLQKISQLQIWNNSNFSEQILHWTLQSPTLIKLQSLSLSRIKNISPVIVDVISEYYKNLKFLALYQCPRIVNTDYKKQLKSKFRNIDVVLY